MPHLPKQPTPKPYVARLQPYIPGKPIREVQEAFGLETVVKLASNENPLGPAPEAKNAINACLDQLHLYPENTAPDLLAALAQKHQVDLEQIALGAGSSHILELIARAYAGPGDEVVYSQYGFICYPIFTQGVGACGVPALEKNYTADPEALLAAIGPKTKILFLANPNNPTGTMLGEKTLRDFLARIPPYVLVVLDEAYAEYAQAEGGCDGVTLLKKHPNLLVVRTFSKVYGLAALRIGYGVGAPEVVSVLQRLCPPFSVSTPACRGATAALRTKTHIQESVKHNMSEKKRLVDAYEALGLLACPSYGNFLLLDVQKTGRTPAALFAAFQEKGLIVRPLGGYGLKHHVRLSIGWQEENNQALEQFKKFFA